MMRRILIVGLLALTSTYADAAPSQTPTPVGSPTRLSAKVLADTPVTAPSAVSSAAPVVSQQTHDDIMALLQITLTPRLGAVTKIMSAMYLTSLQAKYRDMSPAIADEIRADIAKVIADPDRVKVLEESMVPIYAKLYSDDEIRQILAFSKTSAGSKMFSGVPNEQQLNEAMQPWAMGTVVPAILMDTAQVLKKHNITVNPDGTSNSTGNP